MNLRPRFLSLAFALTAAPLALAQSSAGWKLDHTAGAMRVEVRQVPGSSFDEVRVITRSRLPLSALCDAVWGKDAGLEGNFKKRVVIRESATERLTYEQIKVPLVQDRDYVMFNQLVSPASSGRCEVRFEARADPAYPEQPGFVRLTAVRGSWVLEPARDGTVVVTYVIYSEPGGGVPALFARGSQREAAADFMKTILARASR